MYSTEIIRIKDYQVLPPFEAQSLAVRNGGIVAFPTETVYGIAVSVTREDAIESVFRIKERDRGKPLTLHISDASAVDEFVDWTRLSEEDKRRYRLLVERFWPGPLAIILPKKETVSDALTGGLSTIAFRFPSHPVSIAFIKACGGVVAGTSANVSGNFSCTTGAAVLEELEGKIEYILEADQGILGIESTIVAIGGGVTVLRHGAVGIPMLKSVLGSALGGISRAEKNASSEQNPSEEGGGSDIDKTKVCLYPPEEVTAIFEHLVSDERVAAVLFSDSIYYNISPLLNDKGIKSRVRIMTKESFVAKFYKVLRMLNKEGIVRIYIPRMDGDGVESAICDLFR